MEAGGRIMKAFADRNFVKILCQLYVLRKYLVYYCQPQQGLFHDTEEMLIDGKICLKNNCKCFQFYSLAFDESTDITDIFQLTVFVLKIKPDFATVYKFTHSVQ